MSNKTKNVNNLQEVVTDTAQNVGLALMAGAAIMLNMPEPSHSKHKLVMPSQPVFAEVGVTENVPQGGGNQQERREREETGPHYTSYGLSQRTPGRSGKA